MGSHIPSAVNGTNTHPPEKPMLHVARANCASKKSPMIWPWSNLFVLAGLSWHSLIYQHKLGQHQTIEPFWWLFWNCWKWARKQMWGFKRRRNILVLILTYNPWWSTKCPINMLTSLAAKVVQIPEAFPLTNGLHYVCLRKVVGIFMKFWHSLRMFWRLIWLY